MISDETMHMIFRLCSIVLFVATVTSCSGNYQIEGTYPSPLVPALPVQLDLEYDDTFGTYTYFDGDAQDNGVSIAIGPAQVQLFETIIEGMFEGGENAPVLKMKPAVNGFQYAVPRETRSEVYEVWIKYRIDIEDSDGNAIADWIITGYGKTPTALLKSQGAAINAATNIALRDIGTQLAIGFKRQPSISLWLSNNLEASQL